MSQILSSKEGLAKAAIGMLAGTVATGPMTLAMALSHRLLPSHERYPLPPREITDKLSAKLGLDKKMNGTGKLITTLAAHFGYGSAAGLIYSLISGTSRLPVLAKGLIFGIALWIASYLGLLPALRILSPATQHPARRNLLMVGAHLIWGAALSGLVQFLLKRWQRRHSAF